MSINNKNVLLIYRRKSKAGIGGVEAGTHRNIDVLLKRWFVCKTDLYFVKISVHSVNASHLIDIVSGNNAAQLFFFSLVLFFC